MPNDNRSADRQDLESLTREFLAKGGKIVQCPPGSSDNVVYKKGNFRRRPPADAAARTAAEAGPAPVAGDGAAAPSAPAADGKAE